MYCVMIYNYDLIIYYIWNYPVKTWSENKNE